MLRRGFLGGAALLLGAFAVAVVRERRSGAAYGEVADLMEHEWFSAGKVFVTVLVGLAGSWAAACVGGTRSGLSESVPILFPSGLAAAFVVCRRDAVDDRHALSVKIVALVAAPFALGTVMTSRWRKVGAGPCHRVDRPAPQARTGIVAGNVEGPHRERWGPSTSCPVRHWRRIRDSNS
ncbi:MULTISPECIES: hypothetical protein [unclassified Streptomyces]|uniref:hypothetical protein n=1 Tax=unclassified Streptomyces TaxID=2593676 RepID=UPI0019406AB5|nr:MULTISPECIES: hypothetical protein [unclassified Streptomyces]